MACVNMISERDYIAAYTLVARELIEEHGDDRCALLDAIGDAVYQHPYTCITPNMYATLWHSKNEDAYFEETGEKLEARDMCQLLETLSAWAFRRDVQEQIERELETAKVKFAVVFKHPTTKKVIEKHTVERGGDIADMDDAVNHAREQFATRHGNASRPLVETGYEVKFED